MDADEERSDYDCEVEDLQPSGHNDLATMGEKRPSSYRSPGVQESVHSVKMLISRIRKSSTSEKKSKKPFDPTQLCSGVRSLTRNYWMSLRFSSATFV